MDLIVAVDKNWGIGKNNELLFRLPRDMHYFVEHTQGKTVLMGGNTLRSFPGGKPLKGRRNVVLTSSSRDDCECVGSVDQLVRVGLSCDSMVIGGASVYRQLLDYCTLAYITKVEADGEADVFFENLDELDNWSLDSESEPLQDGKYTIRFCVYRNKSVKNLD